jgi:hypothetical protein
MRGIHLCALVVLAACNDPEAANVDIDDRMIPLAVDAGPGTSDGGTSGAGPVHSFKSTSDIASAYGGNGWDSQFFVRTGKGSDGLVHIDFSSMKIDPTSWACVAPPWWPEPDAPMFCGYTRRVFTQAFGTLPAASYKSTQGFAQLAANLVNGPTLTVTSCTYDDSTFNVTCGAAAGGPIDVRWRASGWFSSAQTGTTEQTYGLVTFRRSGSLKAQGADVTGAVLGTTVDGSSGDIVRTTGAAIVFDTYRQ